MAKLRIDCESCIGTGIGHIGADSSCGSCKGRGYNILDNIELDGIDHNDHPKYCDAFISSADYNGETMTDDQLDSLNEDSELIHELVTEATQGER